MAVSGGKLAPPLRPAEATAGGRRHDDGVAGGERRLTAGGRTVRIVRVAIGQVRLDGSDKREPVSPYRKGCRLLAAARLGQGLTPVPIGPC